MTVTTLYEPDVYNGDGSVDTFPVTFDFLSNSACLKVSLKNETTLVYTTCAEHLQYEVSGTNVVFNTGYIPTTNEIVIIEFVSDWFQSSDYVENSALPAENMEDDFDKLKLEVQSLRDLAARALRVGPEVDLGTTDPTDYFDIALTPGLEALGLQSSDLLDIADNWTPASLAGSASLRLKEDVDNGTSGVYIKAPASLAADVTLTLPDNDGEAGQVLKTDGSGNLSWGTDTATAAGDTYDVQYNDSDVLAGNSSFTTDGTGVVYSATYNARNILSVGSNTTATRGHLDLYEVGTSGVATGHAVRFYCPANGTMSGNVNFYVPYALPAQSGSVLTCTDAGVMSWSLPSYTLNSAWTAATTTVGASLDFAEGTNNGGSYVRIKSPDSLAGNVTLTLPTTDGDANQVLKTDGSGNLSWVDQASVSSSVGDIGSTTVLSGIPLTWNAGTAIVFWSNTGAVSLSVAGASGYITAAGETWGTFIIKNGESIALTSSYNMTVYYRVLS